MKLVMLSRLLVPAAMLVLVGCTLIITSAARPDLGTGLGSGSVAIKDVEGATLFTCTITRGVFDPACSQNIETQRTVILVPVAAPDSEFGGWSDHCDIGVTAVEDCIVAFGPTESGRVLEASFRRLSCQGTDACLNAGPRGEGSCNGTNACQGSAAVIGNNSCAGVLACSQTVGSIGNNSCNGDGTCLNNTATVGNCQRNFVAVPACPPQAATPTPTATLTPSPTATVAPCFVISC